MLVVEQGYPIKLGVELANFSQSWNFCWLLVVQRSSESARQTLPCGGVYRVNPYY
jgi:hypothetical protein